MEMNNIVHQLQSNQPPQSTASIKVYSRSLHKHEGVKLLMVRQGENKHIIAAGTGELYRELDGAEQNGFKLCPLSHENRLVINRYFPHTVPQAFGKQVATFGLGDRLGLAGPGLLQTIAERNVKPILAQQSIRELNLTGRSYPQVLDAAIYAVFQEGYKGGFGADGDHLKVEADIKMSIELGFTMLTLDCSEKIDNEIEDMKPKAVEEKYNKLPTDVKKHFEDRYLNQTFQVGAHFISFDQQSLMKNVLIYGKAVQYMIFIHDNYVSKAGREIDFEISIDETLTPTAPESHYFVAQELYDRGLDIFSMAPRFCGEFQKGIDYIGDIEKFDEELLLHAAIADLFGYKLSIHSGSDKFSVFPVIGKYTKGRWHVKTAGTNWLEAIRTVAVVHPGLYRKMHQYALDHFEEATAYYHVKADITTIKPLSEVSDEDLPSYMDDDDTRQMIHITYGILLQAKDAGGSLLFKDEFFRTLIEHEEMYADKLKKHIGRHFESLGASIIVSQ